MAPEGLPAVPPVPRGRPVTFLKLEETVFLPFTLKNCFARSGERLTQLKAVIGIPELISPFVCVVNAFSGQIGSPRLEFCFQISVYNIS